MDDAALDGNHIALLHHRAKNSGNTVLFKLPILRGSEPPKEWTNKTVAQFATEVDRVAKFVMIELKTRDIPLRSVVTVLYSGSRHQDLIYAIALSRASYIPQMCPHILTHPEVVFALMEKAGSKILLYDPSLEHVTTDYTFPKMSLTPIDTIEHCSTMNGDLALPPVEDLASASDFGFIYLTSGSTSGSPKVVPLTQKFVSVYYKTQFGLWIDGKQFDTQNAFLSRGSICAVAPMIQYLGCLYTESCIVQPSKMRFSTEELFNLVNVCGLNRMTTFGTWLTPHIQTAKKDPAVLKLLQEMRTVSYGGVPISIADDDWCFQNGIPLMDMYATTECGTLMISAPGKPPRFMRPIPGISYRFDPLIDDTTGEDNTASTQLVKFVLLADSPQTPQPHLLGDDGNFHTGDLFEDQADGSYLFRGRGDDFIKSEDSRFIDTKFVVLKRLEYRNAKWGWDFFLLSLTLLRRTIEEQIYSVCSDLVKDCIVVGYLRPSPALFIEVRQDTLSKISEDGLKESVLRRLEYFNARQYAHERIADKRLVFIVDEGDLPRTMKGNFKRRAIEQKYQKELDAVYMSIYGL